MRSEGYSLPEIKKRLIGAQWDVDLVEKVLASRPDDISFQESLRQEILLLGLSFASFGDAVVVFLLPSEFQKFLENSLLLPSAITSIPYLALFVGIHSITLGVRHPHL